MDFNRGNNDAQPVSSAPSSVAPNTRKSTGNNKKPGAGSKSMKLVSSILFVSMVVLVSAVLLFVAFGTSNKNTDASFVKTDKMQAVFLNGGQVYFGQITDLNSDFTRLANIYYLRVEQQVQPGDTSQAASDISLAKLGCELHGPEDSMVINREQIIFWENLKDDGQVAKAVERYVKDNPNGQECATPSTSDSDSLNKETTGSDTP